MHALPPTEQPLHDKPGFKRAQSLRTTLALSLVILVLLTAVAIAAVSLHNGASATNELAIQILQRVQANVEQKLSDYLALPHMLNRLNAEELRRNPHNLTRLVDLRSTYLNQLRAFDPIMTVAVGVEQTGEFVGLGRRDGVTYESGLMERRVDTTYRVYLLDGDGAAQGVLGEMPNYDARLRPWYQAAVRTGKAAWSPIYVWASQQHVGITAVLPIYDDAGTLLGVHQSALSLEYLSRFLGSLEISKSGQIFLIERSGLLIATSTDEKPIRSAATDAKPARFPATESADPFTRAAAEHLMTRFGDLNRLTAPYHGRVSLAGQPYYLSAAGLHDPYGLDWIAVIGIPEANFLGPATAHMHLTILLSAAAIFAAAIAGIIVARRITEPLHQLNTAVRELARGHWDKRINIKRSDEVGELAHEFNRMADALTEKEAQLRAYAESLEQRVAERSAALQASEENFRRVVENAPNGIVIAAEDGRHLYANRRAAEILGYTPEELLQTSMRDLAHPSAYPMLQQRLQDRIAGRPLPAAYETIIRRKDGTSISVEIAGVRTGWQGQVCDLVFFHDISEHKRMEEALQQRAEGLTALQANLLEITAPHDLPPLLHKIVERSAQLLNARGGGMYLCDPDRREVRCVVSYNTPRDYTGTVLAYGEGAAGVVAQTGKPLIIDDYRVWDKRAAVYDKEQPFTAVLSAPMIWQEQVIGVIHVLDDANERRFTEEDLALLALFANHAAIAVENARLYEAAQNEINERKRVEETLRRALTDLERSNTDLERFAYVASHDLQEPLRMVASFVQLLADRYRGQLDTDADEFIAFAVDGAKRMQRLINDLLEYSRVNTRGGPLRPADANVALDDALWNLDLAIRDAGAAITRDPLPTVMADPIQLTQLFQNLIGNAIKFRGAEPPVVHVTAELRSAEDSARPSPDQQPPAEWIFAVRDNGIGIDPKDHERIFGIFQRLHTQEEYAGTGIGLAICQRIVERHGGRIWVESQLGQGTTFFFTLPAA